MIMATPSSFVMRPPCIALADLAIIHSKLLVELRFARSQSWNWAITFDHPIPFKKQALWFAVNAVRVVDSRKFCLPSEGVMPEGEKEKSWVVRDLRQLLKFTNTE
jgi:hypothetical protein